MFTIIYVPEVASFKEGREVGVVLFAGMRWVKLDLAPKNFTPVAKYFKAWLLCTRQMFQQRLA